MSQILQILAVMMVFAISLIPSLSSAETSLNDYKLQVIERQVNLENIEQSVDKLTSDELVNIRARVRDIRNETLEAVVPFREELQSLNENLAALGPEPENDAQSETRQLSSERERIKDEIAAYDTVVRQADLNVVTADRLLDTISKVRRSLFYDNIFKVSPPPFGGKTLFVGVAGFLELFEPYQVDFEQYLSNRASQQHQQSDQLIWVIALISALAFFTLSQKLANKWANNYFIQHEPSQSKKVLVAGARTIAGVIPGIVSGVIIAVALNVTDVIGLGETRHRMLTSTIWLSFLAVLAINSLAKAVFANTNTTWAIYPLPNGRSFTLRLSLAAVTIILSIDAVLRVISTQMNAPQETVLVQSAIVSVILAFFIYTSTRILWRNHTQGKGRADSTQSNKLAIWGGIIFGFIVIATLMGFVALGYFVSTRLVFLSGLAAGAWSVRTVLREFLFIFIPNKKPDAQITPTEVEPAKDEQQRLLRFWAALVLDCLVILVLLIPVFLILGAAWSDVRVFLSDAFYGFQIGSFTISLSTILYAIFTFSAILWVTRVIQNTAEHKILPNTNLDIGVRNSFTTLIGYIGIVIAALSAVGAIGADLSSLAIIAGALSVGIGFGLQSIVSNFVSGLILLFERPIKVGDWIIVQSGEGHVKKISVRSTEIITFDKSSVIVPNSELISGSVTNMTLGDTMGRIKVPVSVSYDCDPEYILKLLTDITNSNPTILSDPMPAVIFSGMGESSIDFEIRGFINDISKMFVVMTELRVAIFKRLKEENIEIPFPQRVVHMAHGEQTLK